VVVDAWCGIASPLPWHTVHAENSPAGQLLQFHRTTPGSMAHPQQLQITSLFYGTNAGELQATVGVQIQVGASKRVVWRRRCVGESARVRRRECVCVWMRAETVSKGMSVHESQLRNSARVQTRAQAKDNGQSG
jgi:hypothetical protein